jgi:Fe-S cluster biogenesis protein NfuA
VKLVKSSNEEIKKSIVGLLDNLRPGFESDGYDIQLVSINNNQVNLRLVLTPEACMDCIMPSDYLSNLFSDVIKKDTGLDITVHLDDPRE